MSDQPRAFDDPERIREVMDKVGLYLRVGLKTMAPSIEELGVLLAALEDAQSDLGQGQRERVGVQRELTHLRAEVMRLQSIMIADAGLEEGEQRAVAKLFMALGEAQSERDEARDWAIRQHNRLKSIEPASVTGDVERMYPWIKDERVGDEQPEAELEQVRVQYQARRVPGLVRQNAELREQVETLRKIALTKITDAPEELAGVVAERDELRERVRRLEHADGVLRADGGRMEDELARVTFALNEARTAAHWLLAAIRRGRGVHPDELRRWGWLLEEQRER